MPWNLLMKPVLFKHPNHYDHIRLFRSRHVFIWCYWTTKKYWQKFKVWKKYTRHSLNTLPLTGLLLGCNGWLFPRGCETYFSARLVYWWRCKHNKLQSLSVLFMAIESPSGVKVKNRAAFQSLRRSVCLLYCCHDTEAFLWRANRREGFFIVLELDKNLMQPYWQNSCACETEPRGKVSNYLGSLVVRETGRVW